MRIIRYFCGDYTPRGGYKYSDMNDLISNFKKPVNIKKENPLEWQYKEKFIMKIGNMIASFDEWEALKRFTWVPIPPSKNKADSLYDDRLIRVLKVLKKREEGFDYRELVVALESRDPASHGDDRPTPEEHYQNYKIDRAWVMPIPENIVVFDDVITTGSGFKAMKRILGEEYPRARILGFFMARVVRHEGLP